MQRIANPYYVFKRRVGSTPTPSAILFVVLCFMASCHPVFAQENYYQFLSKYVPIKYEGYYCKDYSMNAYYLPRSNSITLCKDNIVNKFGVNAESIMIDKLLHEAVHLAQDCKAGFQNAELESLQEVKYISAKVKRLYKEKYHIIEAEANNIYKNTRLVFDLVSKYCGRV